MAANDRQVGGAHYKKGGEEHWDRAWRLRYDPFQYIITKWIERWREKDGLNDLLKAQHALEKYIEVVKAEEKKDVSTNMRYTGIGSSFKCALCGSMVEAPTVKDAERIHGQCANRAYVNQDGPLTHPQGR